MRDRYNLRGHVQLNYVMLGEQDAERLIDDEGYVRESRDHSAKKTSMPRESLMP